MILPAVSLKQGQTEQTSVSRSKKQDDRALPTVVWKWKWQNQRKDLLHLSMKDQRQYKSKLFKDENCKNP